MEYKNDDSNDYDKKETALSSVDIAEESSGQLSTSPTNELPLEQVPVIIHKNPEMEGKIDDIVENGKRETAISSVDIAEESPGKLSTSPTNELPMEQVTVIIPKNPEMEGIKDDISDNGKKRETALSSVDIAEESPGQLSTSPTNELPMEQVTVIIPKNPEMEGIEDDIGDNDKKRETALSSVDIAEESNGQLSTSPTNELPLEQVPVIIDKNPEMEGQKDDIGDNGKREIDLSSVDIAEESPGQLSTSPTNELPLEQVPVIIYKNPEMEGKKDDIGDNGKRETALSSVDIAEESSGQLSTNPMNELPMEQVTVIIPKNPEMKGKKDDIGDNGKRETVLSSVDIAEESPGQLSNSPTNELPLEQVPVIIPTETLENDVSENAMPENNEQVLTNECTQTDQSQAFEQIGLTKVSNDDSEIVESGDLNKSIESEDGLETVSRLSNNSMPLKSLTLRSHQKDILNETTSVSSSMSEVSLSELGNTMRRRTTPHNIGRHNEDIERNRHSDDDNQLTKKPHYERRKVFNILKHSISIVFIVIDLLLDWVMYTEMNERGTYVIAAERRLRNIEFTIGCEGTGADVQLVFLIFTIIGTVLAVLQILNIIYQIYYEIKGVYYSKRLLHEVIETFALLFLIEMSQILLIMGFYDVCTLDCVVNATEVRIVMNAIFSFMKISWRFFTRWKCCTYRWVIPKTRGHVNYPVRPRSTPSRAITRPRSIPSRLTDNRNMGPGSRWNCEQSCKCCILRWSAGEPDESFECTCGKCLRCQQMCGCCILRCFPSHLEPPQDDICTCRCADCLSCEQPCKCCTFRCFPSRLNPPEDDICTCRCADCLSCEQPCKCFTFRCFPSHLYPPKTGICACTCGQCLSCEQPCKCLTFRCFPKHLNPPHPDICTCRCTECLSCEIPCKCCIVRCFPEHLGSPNWFDCTFGDCMKCQQTCCCCILRCFPSHLGENEACTCIFRQCTACEHMCGCFLCRCFPTELDPSKPEICECTCGKCLVCEQEACCCKLRCFPSHLTPPKSQWCECSCNNENVRVVPISIRPQPHLVPQIAIVNQPVPRPQSPCLASEQDTCSCKLCCCPTHLTSPKTQWCKCSYCNESVRVVPEPIRPQPRPVPRIVIVNQPVPQPPPPPPPQLFIVRRPTPPPPPPRPPPTKINYCDCIPSGTECKKCCLKLIHLLIGVMIVIIFFLFALYLFLEIVQIRFVLACVANDTLMNAIQEGIVQNYLKIYKI